MKSTKVFSALALLLATSAAGTRAADTTNSAGAVSATNAAAWLDQPLSLAGALDVALQRNGAVLKSQAELEATYGVVVQTRAIALPRVQAVGSYTWSDAIDQFTFPNSSFSLGQENTWNAGLKVVQSIYEGGRITSSLRTARLTKEQALLQHEAVVKDTILVVRIAYDDALLAVQQIAVEEASVALLQKELENTSRRFDAGTVPQFNVLRAEVEVANQQPKLIRAKNAYRIAKNNLAKLLGYRVPATVWEDIPLQLTGRLAADPFEVELPDALARALANRPELGALRKVESLRKEGVTSARSGQKPSVQVFGGYGVRNSQFTDDLAREVHGWNAGAQVTWDIFDGKLTRGKVQEARGLHDRARADLDDTEGRVELEVRTAYSNFIEAKEVLESQKKVQQQAQEALRLAASRYDAGTGTQLDVLDAQTSLTQARTTQIQALHGYSVALARFEHAIGEGPANISRQR